MSKYAITISQSGDHSTSVVGDHAQLIANFTPSSSAQELIEVLKALQGELERMDLPADVKDEANLDVDRAIRQAKKEPLNAPELLQSLKNLAARVKHPASIAIGVGKFWSLLRKAIEWLG